ncbi:hypothetical protein PUNSTDRAFT_105179 [Punctularia strigosozonata HHB-11173 SS5]|uniref:uncharacterized protein n=1 Tax=Punctularia strigosozonata (strain HHB-11173) TaxID=741275 RepID=UPI0004417CFD|nr:uncharacterized protein PUNSTDRAFT_105179 [Punctularia strigosozonata HHB-11173 SS5]EIN07442.1 hypothetical protein PUNSTDRAFT_105179 [Punctularia strigosozonata HHB-11173 SS5]
MSTEDLTTTELARRIRELFEDAPDAQTLPEILKEVDTFVLSASTEEDSEGDITDLQEQLQIIHKDAVDGPQQTEMFLTVLQHLRPILTPSSVVTNWWDLVLRPALRNPQLPGSAAEYAKDLVISAFEDVSGGYIEEVDKFRRQLMELYLLDALNEGSGEEVFEFSAMDEEGRERSARWKANLEDILVRYAISKPEDLLLEVNHQYADPSTRLQMLSLLDVYTSRASLSCARILAAHPLMSSLLHTLLLDNSSTVCTMGLTLMTKLLPMFAKEASDSLKGMLPDLLSILARMLCWKHRQVGTPPSPESEGAEPSDEDDDPPASQEEKRELFIRDDIPWKCLQATINTTPPSPHQFLTILYYLFPCNVIRFLRDPLPYLEQYNIKSPYTISWEEVLDEVQLKTRVEPLLRGHVMHPSLIWRDAATELSEDWDWSNNDLAEIVTESFMLDVRNAGLAVRQSPQNKRRGTQAVDATTFEAEDSNTPRVHSLNIQEDTRPHVSLRTMIDTALMLKSGEEVEVVDPVPGWPSTTILSSHATRARRNDQYANAVHEEDYEGEELSSRALQTVSNLQREILLLRNELNFEVWLSRENVKHIGRLYKNHILTKDAEVEQQGLRNKLRDLRAQVVRLQKELKEQKELAARTKQQNKEWNENLQKRLDTFREKNRKWEADTANLRSDNAKLEAQGKLLADAVNRVFTLETKIKETAPQVERLKDYERRIEQHTTMQMLWDEDVQKLNDQEEEMKAMMSRYKKMEMRVEAFEQQQSKMESDARAARLRIQELEAQVGQSRPVGEPTQQSFLVASIEAAAKEKDALRKSNEQLRKTSTSLREENEALKARLEQVGIA